jgi:hypothetical protein
MNPEHLIAELVNKLHSGAIDPHGPNTEADVRGIVMKHWEESVTQKRLSWQLLKTWYDERRP